MKYVLETNDLTKCYGKFKALDRVSMSIPKGSIYGFVGRNGAGKTTLIRLICGLQEPTSGEYTIYDIPNSSKGISAARKRMGAVVETPALYLDMTAQENLKQHCLLLGVPNYEEIPRLLKLVGLQDVGNKKVFNFSLGMKQRLGIAIALVGNPDFIVLDEPTNGLDPQGIIEMRELILKLNKNNNITFFVSSHILDELSKIATNYGFIDKGSIIKEISADELNVACRKSVHVVVSNIKALVIVLDKMKLEYEINSDSEADIYSKVNISSLVKALDKEKCELLSLNEKDESLENYFINLVGGERNE